MKIAIEVSQYDSNYAVEQKIKDFVAKEIDFNDVNRNKKVVIVEIIDVEK